jgi:serine/threonine protein kinase
MALAAGTKLGPYEILSPIGAGGMGEVYRARDSKLKRDVALKVLPEAFAEDPDRMARFQREAEVLASLNHTNIAQIYGVEERALVMELVEGESPKGPMPFDEGWKIASQIAAGLEYAHEKGIVHRDLKPANVRVTADGVVKLLDFGLAKAFAGQTAVSADPENSPTLTLGATQVGVILGTAAYMAPEQAKAKNIDKRADVWSFGVVFYELLTGERLFAGEDVSDTLAQVLTKQPDLERVPLQAQRLLRECLEKDQKQRLRDIGDAKRLIEVERTPPAMARQTSRLWPAITVALFLALAAVSFLHFRASSSAGQPLHLSIALPDNASVRSLALSPDARNVVIAAVIGSEYHLWLRSLSSPDLQPLPGTDEARAPFWSPDSRFIGFFADGKLKTMPATGGPAQVLCDAVGVGGGGTWNQDGVILFAGANLRTIHRVSASGGACAPLPKQAGGSYPEFLPDGRHFFYVATGNAAGVYLASFDDPNGRRVLADRSSVGYVPPAAGRRLGSLLFLRGNALMFQPFDPAALQNVGDVVRVAGGASFSNSAPQMAASVSAAGVLVYLVNGDASGAQNVQIAWFDRSGKELERVGNPGALRGISLSPDERTVAESEGGASLGVSLWLYDLARHAQSRLIPASAAAAHSPVWSPDGRHIAFSLQVTGQRVSDLYSKDLGRSPEAVLLRNDNMKFPSDWSRDDRYLVYTEIGPKTDGDIWLLPDPLNASSGRKPVPFLRTEFVESQGQISPDGHWIAYVSNESGRYEVYVHSFPSGERKWQVSTKGGVQPRWRGDSKELFYLEGLVPRHRMMGVTVAAGSSLAFESPKPLFEFRARTDLPIANIFSYSPSADGRRYLIATSPSDVRPSLDVLLNWQPETR